MQQWIKIIQKHNPNGAQTKIKASEAMMVSGDIVV